MRNHFEDAAVHALENSHNNIPLHIFIKEISYLRYFQSKFVNRLLARERTQKKSFYQTSTFLQLLQ